ncbi:unnamed protein product [Trichogramma brassicae]|uniref:Uncharacterized protein n=1 Tax=Trichogramma brassicae TaxID=86971 RepID=A0A6H5IFQ3_9HYME|nr:unnamed protein product [Trichogramma brassicae]
MVYQPERTAEHAENKKRWRVGAQRVATATATTTTTMQQPQRVTATTTKRRQAAGVQRRADGQLQLDALPALRAPRVQAVQAAHRQGDRAVGRQMRVRLSHEGPHHASRGRRGESSILASLQDDEERRAVRGAGRAAGPAGHVVDAIQVYQEALTIEPDNNEVAADLGLLYLRLGDSRKAFQQFGKVLAEEPREFINGLAACILALNSYIHLHMFVILKVGYMEKVNEVESIKQCGSHVADLSNNAEYRVQTSLQGERLLVVRVYKMKKKIGTRSMAPCSQLDTRETSPGIRALPMALKRLDDLEGAEKALEKAHALAPQDPQVLLNYAVIMDALKRHERAKEFLIILNDVTALIDVDPQITKMAKHLAAKLRISDPSSSHISVSGGSSPTGAGGGGGGGGIGGGDISPSLQPAAARTTTTSRLSPMLLAPPAPPSPFADEISRTLSEDEV